MSAKQTKTPASIGEAGVLYGFDPSNTNKINAMRMTATGAILTSPGLGSKDVTGRQKVSFHQNIYDADFEYGTQPLRWENLLNGAGTITHLPGEGGVRMRITTAANDITIRQSRPYHRYQPGKTMRMATACNFGTAQANQRQRVGFFDDSNGVFFEQADPTGTNPYGMHVVVRNDINNVPTDTRISIENWNGDKDIIASLDWTRIQMLEVEYAWYGAGALRWGVYINGDYYLLHVIGTGNSVDVLSAGGRTKPWSRTGNLPVRYEQRNLAAVAASNDFIHYGVSVIVEGGVDDQRGFTYPYGLAIGTPRRNVPSSTIRFPILSIKLRSMGTVEASQSSGSGAITSGTTTGMTVTNSVWTVNQWVGRFVFFPSLALTARITANTANTLTFADVVSGLPIPAAPTAGIAYQIGLLNRGQLLPKKLRISASALAQIELIASIPGSPIVLTGANFVSTASLGSVNSFGERDVSATAYVSGGEVVERTTLPAGGSGLVEIDLQNLFPLYNSIRGNQPDTLTLVVTTGGSASDVGADLLAQEAMS